MISVKVILYHFPQQLSHSSQDCLKASPDIRNKMELLLPTSNGAPVQAGMTDCEKGTRPKNAK